MTIYETDILSVRRIFWFDDGHLPDYGDIMIFVGSNDGTNGLFLTENGIKMVDMDIIFEYCDLQT